MFEPELFDCPQAGCRNLVRPILDGNDLSFESVCAYDHNLNDDGPNFWMLVGAFNERRRHFKATEAVINDLRKAGMHEPTIVRVRLPKLEG